MYYGNVFGAYIPARLISIKEDFGDRERVVCMITRAIPKLPYMCI